jgi:hypothetical protein
VKVLLNIPTPFLCGRVQATRRIRPGSRDDLSRELAQALPRVVYKFIVALWLARLSFDGVKTEAAGQGATISNNRTITTGCGLDDLGLIPSRARCFSIPQCLDQVWGTLSLLYSGWWGLVPWEVKWLGHEADHSPPSCAEV